jgi:hypothetical protein
MKYFIDQEFCEGFHKPWFGKRRHYIDLISIGIVAEDGREYYAVSNEFDVDAVWNRFDIEQDFGKPQDLGNKKVYWLRDNVLMPIFYDMAMNDFHHTHFKDEWHKGGVGVTLEVFKNDPVWSKDIRWFKMLIKKYGKSNEQIANEIIRFIMPSRGDDVCDGMDFIRYVEVFSNPEFYGYYADYDWVLFCSLFGRMIDLPKGFPKYCIDLKQTQDEKSVTYVKVGEVKDNYQQWSMLKDHPDYPTQINEHNALADARWIKKLYTFLKSLK